MKKVQGIDTGSVNRREFLELALASSLIPRIATGRGDTPQKAAGNGTAWMNEQPMVFSQPWQMPLYAHRTGGYPVWQDQSWEYAFTEKAAKEMKDMGVTVIMVSLFEGYGILAERSLHREVPEGRGALAPLRN